jgi:hypothetical protein
MSIFLFRLELTKTNERRNLPTIWKALFHLTLFGEIFIVVTDFEFKTAIWNLK